MAGLTDWWVELVGPRREGRKGARRGSRSFLAGKFWSPEQARVTLPTALSTPTEAMRSRESASDWRVRRRPIHRDGARRGKDAPVDRGRGSWVGGCRRARTSDRESPRRRARGGHRAPETTGFHLLAFSCQTRNFCSSCQAKRSVLFAENSKNGSYSRSLIDTTPLRYGHNNEDAIRPGTQAAEAASE